MTPNNEPTQQDEPYPYSSIRTESMVTIRLSNSTIAPLEDSAIEDSPIDAPLSKEKQDGPTDPRKDRSTVHDLQAAPEAVDEEASVLEEEVKLFQRSHRMSTISMPSIAEEAGSMEGSRSFRSRSNSSGTLSSHGSTHVDWEELDKSEESAPRDEGSDEVCEPRRGLTSAKADIIYSQPLFCLLGWSRRTMPLLQTPKQPYPEIPEIEPNLAHRPYSSSRSSLTSLPSHLFDTRCSQSFHQ